MRFFCLGLLFFCVWGFVCLFGFVCLLAFCLFLLSLALSLNLSWSGVFTSCKDESFFRSPEIDSSTVLSSFPCFWNVPRSPSSLHWTTITQLALGTPGSITSAGRRSLWASWRFGGFGKPNYPGDGLTAQHSRTPPPPLVEGQPSWDKKTSKPGGSTLPKQTAANVLQVSRPRRSQKKRWGGVCINI